MVELDNTDRMILQLLQTDGRLANTEIASRVALSPPACWKRLKRLEEKVIRGYHASLEPRELGLGLFAFISIMLDNHSEKAMNQFESGVTALPDDEIATSDVIVPPSNLTLEETRELFSEHGLIPDLPA